MSCEGVASPSQSGIVKKSQFFRNKPVWPFNFWNLLIITFIVWQRSSPFSHFSHFYPILELSFWNEFKRKKDVGIELFSSTRTCASIYVFSISYALPCRTIANRHLGTGCPGNLRYVGHHNSVSWRWHNKVLASFLCTFCRSVCRLCVRWHIWD